MSDAQSLLAHLDVNISTNFDSACGRPTTVGSSSRSGSTDVPVRDSTVTPDHPLATDLPLQPGAAPLLEFLGTSSLNSYFNGYFCDRSGSLLFDACFALCNHSLVPQLLRAYFPVPYLFAALPMTYHFLAVLDGLGDL